MEALKDMWASVVAGVKERTTNPLTFSCLLSWCVWNYKFFVVLTGDGSTSERLSTIGQMYPDARATYLGNALLFPFLTALAYVFLYPYISEKVIRFYRSKQIQIANAVRDIEATRVLTKQEAAALTRRHEEARKEWEAEDASQRQQINELREALASAENQSENLKSRPMDETHGGTDMTEEVEDEEEKEEEEAKEEEQTSATDKDNAPSAASLPLTLQMESVLTLTPQMESLLILLSNSSVPISTDSLARDTRLNYSVALLCLEDMLQKSLVRSVTTPRAGRRWELTNSGRTLAVNALPSSQRLARGR